MKAARLHENSNRLVIEEVPDPVLRPGSVVVRLEAVFVPPFIAGMIEDSSGYQTPPRPFTPGMDAIGVIEGVAPDVSGVALGDRVYCDSYYQSPNPSAEEDFSFIGCFGMGRAAGRLLEHWRDGAFAEKMVLPGECVTPLPRADLASPAVLCRLGWFGTAYGALVKAGFRPGQSLAINGATGLVGAGAILVALAMGARKIIAIGRSKPVLKALGALDARVMATSEPADQKVDVVLDSISGNATASTERMLGMLRRGGTAVLVGSVSEPLHVSLDWLVLNDMTIRGSLWFPRPAIRDLLGMIDSGALDLSAIRAHPYPLSEIGSAIQATGQHCHGLDHVALICSSAPAP